LAHSSKAFLLTSDAPVRRTGRTPRPFAHREGDSVVKYAQIGAIATHLPERVETNDQLRAEFPKWDMDLIYSKTGIAQRHIAEADECSSDLGVKAAQKLFAKTGVDPESIDFLLFCTQTPDYPLPTTACLLQQRLGLKTSTGAFDFNLGCSGFVYGLSMGNALIRSGMASRVLLITAETYSKFIDRADRSLRTIFGDGAAATLIEAVDRQALTSFVFGTDGTGADTLIVNSGGARPAKDAIQPRRRRRWDSKLYMDGPSLIAFTLEMIPKMIDQALQRFELTRDDVDIYIMHQATKKMLDQLRLRLGLEQEKMPLMLENVGNTVSSTIPLLIEDLRKSGRLRPGMRAMLVGFGVGYSWAGCLWEES